MTSCGERLFSEISTRSLDSFLFFAPPYWLLSSVYLKCSMWCRLAKVPSSKVGTRIASRNRPHLPRPHLPPSSIPRHLYRFRSRVAIEVVVQNEQDLGQHVAKYLKADVPDQLLKFGKAPHRLLVDWLVSKNTTTRGVDDDGPVSDYLYWTTFCTTFLWAMAWLGSWKAWWRLSSATFRARPGSTARPT